MHMGIAIAPLLQCNPVRFGELVSSACVQQTSEAGNWLWRRVKRDPVKVQVKRSCRQRAANPGGRSRATRRPPTASQAAPRRQRPYPHRQKTCLRSLQYMSSPIPPTGELGAGWRLGLLRVVEDTGGTPRGLVSGGVLHATTEDAPPPCVSLGLSGPKTPLMGLVGRLR